MLDAGQECTLPPLMSGNRLLSREKAKERKEGRRRGRREVWAREEPLRSCEELGNA